MRANVILQLVQRLLQGRQAVVAVYLRLALVRHLLQSEDFRRVAWFRPHVQGLVNAVGDGGHVAVLLLQDSQRAHHAVNDRLRPRRAAGDIDIHRDHAIHAAGDIVALPENAAAGRTNADRHHHLWLRQLVVDIADDIPALLVDGARHQEDVRVLGIASVDDAQAFDIVKRRQAG